MFGINWNMSCWIVNSPFVHHDSSHGVSPVCNFHGKSFETLEIRFEIPWRLYFQLHLNDFLTFEILEIGSEVPLRLHFHLDLNDFLTFEVLEIGFEVPLRFR